MCFVYCILKMTKNKMSNSTNRKRRNEINLTILLLTFCILLIGVKLSDGSFATRINKISQNLDKALSEVMIENKVNYTNVTTFINITRIPFHPRGMAGLYNLTNMFIDFLITKDIYPESFLKIKNEKIEVGSIQDEWKELLRKYAGLLIIVIILLLISTLMPLCGFCFCCCRCCGKCGARTRPSDKKNDLCSKIVLATFLISFGTLLLFGVVCAFASNEQIQEGVNELTDNLRKNVKDTVTFMNSTNDQVHTLLIINYNEFEDKLNQTLDQSNDIVFNELSDYSNATAMTLLANVVDKTLPKIKRGFSTLKYSTQSLRLYASQLNDAIRKVKKDLLQTLKSCTTAECGAIRNNISNLQTNIDFSSYVDRYFPRLPDITEQITVLDNLPQESFEKITQKGLESLNQIKEQIGSTVNSTLKETSKKLKIARKEIENGFNNITKILNNTNKIINEKSEYGIKITEYYIKSYGQYRYYIFLGISCSLLLICLFIALGLICGICGKRPDLYGDDDCCNKGAGGQFLICGVMIMFFIGFIISIIILISFLSGILIERIACDPIKNINNSQIIKIINDGIHFNVSDSIIKCYQNKSIYQVLNLKNKFDIDKINESFQIDDILSHLDLSLINFDKLTILSENDAKILYDLANNSSGFSSVNLDHFKDILEENFTTFKLTDIANELENLINHVDDDDLKSQLSISKMNLETYQERIVDPMIKNATAVVNLATELEEDLKLNHSSFKDAIQHMIDELQDAEKTLKKNGSKDLQNIAKEFTNGILNQVNDYLDRVIINAKYQVGKCGAISIIIDNTLTSTCDKILMPWNGFWFGLLGSLILFIPTIIVSVKLAKLYQKYNPYRDNIYEAEYLYDAYADRDNIPLNRYEDRPVPAPAGDMVSRDYPGGSNHPDARYADMAPKHWEEFPAGGPPQYQRAPTEYERPPPYYYPGATEDNP